MRLIHVINSFGNHRGGAERLVQRLHLDLLALGIDSHLIALEGNPTEDVPHSHSLGARSSYSPLLLPKLNRLIRRLGSEQTIIHSHLFPAGGYGALFSALGALPGPLVHTEHNTLNWRRRSAWFRWLDRAYLRGCSRIYAISAAVEQTLSTSYPELADRVEVIENGVDLRFDKFRKRRQTTVLKFLSVGRLHRQKNYDTVLTALSQLDCVEFHYDIVGGGEEEARLRAMVSQLGLTDRVSLHGHVSEPRPFLENADLFLIPSRWEGFGLAAVEAMNASLPIIAANVDGLREVVFDPASPAALLVDPSDATAIASALRTLTSDPGLRRELAKAGFERAARFDSKSMAKRYARAYGRLAADGRAAHA